MANENDNIGAKGPEDQEAPKHHSLMENLGENIEKLNTEFPLSGGETNEDLEHVISDEEGDNNAGKTPKEGEDLPEEHSSIMDTLMSKIQKLDSEFPLSGGETDEDLEDVDDKEEDEETAE
jgi:hypothetical protein